MRNVVVAGLVCSPEGDLGGEHGARFGSSRATLTIAGRAIVCVLAAVPALLVACGDDGAGAHDAAIDGPPPIVSIRALSARVTAMYRCDPQQTGTMIDCANYRLTLSLDNHSASHAVDRVDRFHIEIGAAIFDTGNGAVCDTGAFAVPAGGNSGVIDLDLFWHSSIEGATALFYPCSPPGAEVAHFNQALPAAPTTGRVELRIAGVLDDAVPFEAAAATTLP